MRVQSVCAGAGIVFTDDGWRWRAAGEEVSGMRFSEAKPIRGRNATTFSADMSAIERRYSMLILREEIARGMIALKIFAIAFGIYV